MAKRSKLERVDPSLVEEIDRLAKKGLTRTEASKIIAKHYKKKRFSSKDTAGFI